MSRSPVFPSLWRVAVGALACACAALSEDVVYLRDGGVLTGRVSEQGPYVFVLRDMVSVRVDRNSVVRIERDAALHPTLGPEETLDVVVLSDGRRFSGQCQVRDGGVKVQVLLPGGEALGFPRSEIAEILWRRSGASEQLQWMDKARSMIAAYPGMAADKRLETRRELYRLGSYVVPVLESLHVAVDKETREVVDLTLAAVFLHPSLSSRLKQTFADFPVYWLDPDPKNQIEALRRAAIADPEGVVPLLQRTIKSPDRSPDVQAHAISQLAVMVKNFELLELLDSTRDGRLRMAVAVALGGNGIYAGIPVLIEVLKSEDPLARRMAIDQLREWLGETRGYFADDTAEGRQRAVENWERWWRENGQEVIAVATKAILGPDRIPEADRKKGRDFAKLANDAWTEMASLKPEDEGRAFARDKADYYFDRALVSDPTNTSLRLGRAIFLYVVQADTAQALREMDILQRTLPPGQFGQEKSLIAYHKGRIAMSRGQWDEAERFFTTSAAQERNAVDARFSLAELKLLAGIRRSDLPVELRQSLFKDAAEEFAEVARSLREQRIAFATGSLSLLDEQVLGSFQRGPILRSAEDAKKALAAEEARAYFMAARAHLALNQDPEALDRLEAARKVMPDSLKDEPESRQIEALIRALGKEKQP